MDSPHILDLVITNKESVENIDYLAPMGKSDYSVLLIYASSHANNTDPIPKLNLNKGNYSELQKFLDITWDSLLQPYNNVEMMWNAIKSKLLEAVNRYIPSTTPFSVLKKVKWKRPLDVEIRNTIKQNSILQKCYIRSKDPSVSVLILYEKVRNIVRNKTRQGEKRNQNEIANKCKSNPKRFSKYVKSKTTNKEPIGDLKFTDNLCNQVLATSDDHKAEILCNFFSSVFNHEKDERFAKLDSKNCTYTSELPVFSMDDIKDRLQKLNVNKLPGPDGIHSRILLETANETAYLLQLMFESSFNAKELPSKWNYANITLLHTKGPRTEVGNYRPVSLTNIVCKLMESIIRDNIMNHFIINRLFSNRQFGFVEGRSTTLQLLQVDVIYTDLQKAFDKIPHKRLISKYGIVEFNVPLDTL